MARKGKMRNVRWEEKEEEKRENNNSVKEMKEEHKITWRVVNTAFVTILLQILCIRGKGINVSVAGAKKFSFVSLFPFSFGTRFKTCSDNTVI
jgi:hypothetical protein